MEKAKQKALLIKMDADMHKLLKIKTTEQGINMTTVVLKLIQSYLSGTEAVVENEGMALEKE